MTVGNTGTTSSVIVKGTIVPFTIEEISDILEAHRYLPNLMQCRCQQESEGHPACRPKDGRGLPVYGFFSWREHILGVLLNITTPCITVREPQREATND